MILQVVGGCKVICQFTVDIFFSTCGGTDRTNGGEAVLPLRYRDTRDSAVDFWDIFLKGAR